MNKLDDFRDLLIVIITLTLVNYPKEKLKGKYENPSARKKNSWHTSHWKTKKLSDTFDNGFDAQKLFLKSMPLLSSTQIQPGPLSHTLMKSKIKRTKEIFFFEMRYWARNKKGGFGFWLILTENLILLEVSCAFTSITYEIGLNDTSLCFIEKLKHHDAHN